MAVTSTSEKVGMLSIAENSIPILDIRENYDSCDVNEPTLKHVFNGDFNKSELDVMSVYDLSPENRSNVCCKGALSSCDSTSVIDRKITRVSEDDPGNEQSIESHVLEECQAEDRRCEDADKIVGIAVETDSGNGGSCCENNPDEFSFDESNTDDNKERHKPLPFGDVCKESIESIDALKALQDDNAPSTTKVEHKKNKALEEVNNKAESKDTVKEISVENSKSIPQLKPTISSTSSRPMMMRETPVPHIPRLHRQRIGSYGSPPPSASLIRDGGMPQSFPTSTTGSTAAGCSEDSSVKQQQYVVNVHVNPGETFSVCISDQVQLIQDEETTQIDWIVDTAKQVDSDSPTCCGPTGPATVRMVSNNGPPLPMPMQVPPGHMVQQIIDENGILTNVILSSQPPGIMAPPMMVGYYGGHPASSPYSPYCGPSYPPFAPAPYAVHRHPAIHPSNGIPPGIGHGLLPPPQQLHPPQPMSGLGPGPAQTHHHGHLMDIGGVHHHCSESVPHSTLPAAHVNHSTADDRLPPRIKSRLPLKFYKHKHGYYGNHAPRHSIPHMNGVNTTRVEPPSESSSSEEQEHVVEERRLICEQLSKISIPKILEIEARSALIVLTPPDFNYLQLDVEISELQYELALSECKDSKFNLVYSGDATEITLCDLKPATEYYLKVHSMLDDLRGNPAECVSFKTLCCEPETPSPPKLQSRTVSSITLKWNAALDNGAKISNYALEYEQETGSLNFMEIYCGLQRQFRVNNLVPSTSYLFRLAAINSFGKSEYSRPVAFSTSGVVPSQPDPPMMSERFVTALTVSWIRRPGDDIFTLHMDDESTGHGFIQFYNGSDLSYTVSNLRRNTEYRFRLQASNKEGSSPWSDTVHYKTLCDRPRPPPKPRVKGKVHQQSFRIVWDPPEDTGGVAISHYLVQMDKENGYEMVQNGAGREFLAENLLPGRTYKVCICCVAADKQSDWSEVLCVTTQCVPPSVCRRIWQQGQPQATSLRVCWEPPDTLATEYELLMMSPDRHSAAEVYRGPKTEACVTDLLPGRVYTFQVRALNHAGAGPWSDMVEIMSSPSVPDSPSSPLVVCKLPHVAQISWCKPSDNGAVISEYRLEWQQHSDFDFSPLYCGLSLTAEISGLNPATIYSFRVQAVNHAGAGPFSIPTSCITPPSSPSTVTDIELTPMTTAVVVAWQPPYDNGSPITAYHIILDDRPPIAVDGERNEHVVDDLQPETTYRVRVQAINAIGCGPFCVPVKVKTKSLPPRPPSIDCVAYGCNSLKLKWRDSRCVECSQYSLEMLQDDGSFCCVYRGTGHSYKVTKLNELTEYVFRICATNDAGSGSYSPVSRFSTTRAPPAAVKPPRVSYITTDSCVIDWIPLKATTGDDILVYVLQMAFSRDQTYKQIYRGPHCSYRASGLLHGTEYLVRVFAVRLGKEPGHCERVGVIGLPTSFGTLSARPSRSGGVSNISQESSASAAPPSTPRWSDQQWAILLLVTFTLCAVLIAFVTQQVLLYATSSGSTISSAASVPDEVKY